MNLLPVVIHGDAAISGQGLIYELVQMAQLPAYKTIGSIHIVVNNQVGFTTNYLDSVLVPIVRMLLRLLFVLYFM